MKIVYKLNETSKTKPLTYWDIRTTRRLLYYWRRLLKFWVIIEDDLDGEQECRIWTIQLVKVSLIKVSALNRRIIVESEVCASRQLF
jgi:hypothetical protein